MNEYTEWKKKFTQFWIDSMSIHLTPNINDYTDEQIALAIHLKEYDLEDLCIHEDDYLVYTDEEADIAVFEYIKGMLWSFNSSFLAGETGLDEDIFKALQEKYESSNDAMGTTIYGGLY